MRRHHRPAACWALYATRESGAKSVTNPLWMQPRLGFVKQACLSKRCVLVRRRAFDESAPQKRAPQA
jgi:hypothetical protein